MRKIKMSQKMEKRLIIFSFTIIPLVLLLTFSYYPLVKMFQYSMTDWNGYSPNSSFVGIDNYRTVLTNPAYFTVFKTSMYYFIATFFQLGLALLFATILSFKVKFANFLERDFVFSILVEWCGDWIYLPLFL